MPPLGLRPRDIVTVKSTGTGTKKGRRVRGAQTEKRMHTDTASQLTRRPRRPRQERRKSHGLNRRQRAAFFLAFKAPVARSVGGTTRSPRPGPTTTEWSQVTYHEGHCTAEVPRTSGEASGEDCESPMRAVFSKKKGQFPSHIVLVSCRVIRNRR